MNIGGFLTTTLLDYPGKVAATVFTAGCNMRCPFCQNADLVLNNSEAMNEQEILAHLEKRKKLLDGVCITGGEPTLQSDLADFISKIKDLGLLVKLDSNGLNPDVIKSLHKNNLIDMVAMDIKSGKSGYGLACGIDDSILNYDKIQESIDYLLNSGIDYEFRTTLVKGIHTLDDMKEIGQMISGAKSYYLQSYKYSDNILGNVEGSVYYDSFSREELSQFLEIAKSYVKSASLRGVE